jgi:lysophospholipase L1-like esterase
VPAWSVTGSVIRFADADQSPNLSVCASVHGHAGCFLLLKSDWLAISGIPAAFTRSCRVKKSVSIPLCALLFLWLAAVPSAMAQGITLVSLGDSLTEGAGDTESDAAGRPLGYPGRLLRSLLPEHPGSQLFNLGRSGWTIDELINGTSYDGSPGQLNEALLRLNNALTSGQQAFALLWTGSNDLWAVYEWKCDSASPPSCAEEDLASFRANLESLISALSASGATVVVALLDDHSRRPIVADPAFADALADITPEELPLLAAQVARYNAAISELAHRYGAQTVDFYHTTVFEQTATLNEDGNHPNAAGYDQIAAIWLDGITRPHPDILANGSHGPLSSGIGAPLHLSLNLTAGRENGQNADWFLVQITPNGNIRSFNLGSGQFEDGLFATYQDRLFDLREFPISLDSSEWNDGHHTLFFGIDLTMDRVLSAPNYYDWIELNIE